MPERKKNKKKRQFSAPDVLFGLITCTASVGFFLFIIIILMFTGVVQFNMLHAYFFVIFIALCSIGAGLFVYTRRTAKIVTSANAIVDATEKICRGNYDITFPELPLEYKKVAKSLTELAAYLKGVEKAQNDFINDFSHELKTPIVSIRGFARLLSKGNITDEERQEYLKIIATESDRLIDLTAGTLLLDRLENNRLNVDMKLYNLSEQLRRCILMLQESWEEKGVDIDADFLEFFVYSNEELLSQLFLNVIQNAIKFTPKGGTVRISVKESDKNTTVLIEDDGIGMDEETRKRMFDKYFRGDKSRSTPGNGLGLATVKKIAEVLDLSLDVSSTEGKGTKFYVVFKK